MLCAICRKDIPPTGKQGLPRRRCDPCDEVWRRIYNKLAQRRHREMVRYRNYQHAVSIGRVAE